MTTASPSPQERAQARAFLRHHVADTPEGWGTHLPGLHHVHATHIEDGWVRLRFHGNEAAQAETLADDLLLPPLSSPAAPARRAAAEHVSSRQRGSAP